MKALQTPLGKAVLGDPAACRQLRAFLATKSDPKVWPEGGPVLEVWFEGRLVRVRPKIVPRAG